jgi:hypothetical protein
MDTVEITLLRSNADGDALFINNIRIAGAEAGGKVIQRWQAKTEDILKALGRVKHEIIKAIGEAKKADTDTE